LAGQALSDGVFTAVLFIGANDYDNQSAVQIYQGAWSSSQIQAWVNQTIANIQTALVTVQTAGISVVLVNVVNPMITPAWVAPYPDATGRERVETVIQSANAGLKTLAQY
jgi:lysophospholipase L1-like esterase